MNKRVVKCVVCMGLAVATVFGSCLVNKISSNAASVTERTSSYKINVNHDFSIMSQNVKYQQDKDGVNNTIDKRFERLCNQLDKYDTDIKCFQEFNSSWKSRVQKKLTTEEYYYVQSPYKNTKLSNAIFVKKSKFSYIDSGYMVLTETSSDTSDRSRYASWMKVKHKKTGKVLVVMNAHTTPYCVNRLLQSCQRIKNSAIIKNADNYIIAGDFNMRSQVNAKSYNTMLSNGTKDMCKTAKKEGIRYVVGGTFHKWETKSINERPRLDYFFGSPNLNSSMYTLLNDKYNGGHISDHYGIMNYVTFK